MAENEKKRKGLAITAFVLAIIAFFGAFIPLIGFFFNAIAVLAIVFALVALKQSKPFVIVALVLSLLSFVTVGYYMTVGINDLNSFKDYEYTQTTDPLHGITVKAIKMEKKDNFKKNSKDGVTTYTPADDTDVFVLVTVKMTNTSTEKKDYNESNFAISYDDGANFWLS